MDVAREVTRLGRASIQMDAARSVMTQANVLGELAVRLLGGVGGERRAGGRNYAPALIRRVLWIGRPWAMKRASKFVRGSPGSAGQSARSQPVASATTFSIH